ncbi:FecR family protein [Chitinophaga sp. XS-30]|uniref:FecR family protein n=1 Tax=Chitinophaga sp. XS-30 TaxID=2604421 RepID=UPI0011DD7697|nr:FecR domain-containing protein [Chitinophaga sp. XS-30]QEH40854.1 DUF4974 domain-containing protein [Chitinophaga sp. XS-30]
MQQPVTIEYLVSDETFIACCLGTDPDAVAYWKQKEQEFPQHGSIFREARELVIALHGYGKAKEIAEETAKLKALLHQPEEITITATVPVEARRNRKWHLPAAAVLILLSAITCILIFRQPSASLVMARTGVGEIKKFMLPDGSSVWLNAESRIQYRETFGQQREVTLLEGEACFDVTHDTRKPFSVTTPSGMRVLDLGTVFSVKSYSGLEEESVGVVTGEVILSRSGHQEAISLKAGEGGTINKSSGSLRLMRYSPETAAWMNGRIVLNDVSFRELQLVLRNLYHMHLVFSDPAMADCRITTAFRHGENIREILRTLEIIYGITCTVNGNTIRLKGAPCSEILKNE